MSQILLGKQASYLDEYSPSLLFPINRSTARAEIGIEPEAELPFYGYDIWNCYEVSWLNSKGKPEVRVLEFFVPAESENIVESKSVKLYLNSFNNSKFSSDAEVASLIKQDLSKTVKADVYLAMRSLESYHSSSLSSFTGVNLDLLDISITDFAINNNLPHLAQSTNSTEEVLYSNLLKSNCLVTNQPDWGSIQISYKGRQIDHSSLLKYIISFRNHNEFHEQCVERIFQDILTNCKPAELTVYARYTRRGGVDINPIRSTKHNGCVLNVTSINNLRHVRQ